MNKSRKSVLWQVILPNSNTIHYLMGTMHLKDANAYTFAQQAEKLISSVSQFAGEMNLSVSTEVDLQKYFFLTSGTTLDQYYTDRQFEKMDHMMKLITGTSLTMFNNYIPMAVGNIIAESYVEDRYALPLDQHLWQYADRLGHKMYGLESVADQISILQSISIKYQVSSLKQMFKNVGKNRKNVLSLAEMYVNGDIHSLYRKSKKSMGSIRQLMIYDRNQNMVNRYLELASLDSVFAAVGAAHLSGSKGMLHLLQLHGCRIQPIMP